MLSGIKKKYSPYLDTGLMEVVTQKAAALDMSVNEFVTQALIAFINNKPSEAMIEHLVERILASHEVKSVLVKELSKKITPATRVGATCVTKEDHLPSN